MRRFLSLAEDPRRARTPSLPGGGRRPAGSSPGSTSDGVEVAGQPARCLSLPLVSQRDPRQAAVLRGTVRPRWWTPARLPAGRRSPGARSGRVRRGRACRPGGGRAEAAGVRALPSDPCGGPLEVREVPAPDPAPGGVVVHVGASGICRSDWHAWQGHDPDVVLPHVPGHELAGTVAAVGTGVRDWSIGDRVTVPFVNACGRCGRGAAGDPQVCARQRQPGFTHWGSLAEYVALDAADVNLVAVPEELDLVTAAALGCRYATAFRAVVQVGRVRPGEWVAVHGCGGEIGRASCRERV